VEFQRKLGPRITERESLGKEGDARRSRLHFSEPSFRQIWEMDLGFWPNNDEKGGQKDGNSTIIVITHLGNVVG